MSLTPVTNFDRAEFPNDPPAPDHCAYCQRGIADRYFRVDGNMACTTCAQQAQSLIPPDSHKAYSRALVFGIAAALVGCAAYALIVIITGWTIGYAAIGVAYLVGKAMKAGSRGLGGRRYQITAALLTYAAVAVAFIPIVLYQQSEHPEAKHTATQQATPSTTTADNSAQAAPPKPAHQAVGLGAFLKSIAMLLGIGLISPFLELFNSPGNGLIGAFIIFIGISAAWRLTAKTASTVDGPFENTPSPLGAR